jgi:hypothetical protein
MNHKEKILQISPTPWDSDALGFNTLSLSFSDHFIDLDHLKNLLTVEESSVKEKTLYYCRVNSKNELLKKLLTEHQYYNCETQLRLYRAD